MVHMAMVGHSGCMVACDAYGCMVHLHGSCDGGGCIHTCMYVTYTCTSIVARPVGAGLHDHTQEQYIIHKNNDNAKRL